MLAASPYNRHIFQGSTVFIQREVVVHVDLTEGRFEEVLDMNDMYMKICSVYENIFILFKGIGVQLVV